MSDTARRLHYTIAEYLQLEEGSSVRHEYCGGEIYAMAGGTPEHAALAGALVGSLWSQISPACRVYSSDLRVCVQATGLITYPDVTVVCGRSERASDDRNAVVNPRIVAEVTSDSTEDYDRGEKLRHYREIDSLQEVVFVSHRGAEIEVHRRTVSGWEVHLGKAGDAIALRSVDAVIEVDRIYAASLEERA